MDLKKEIKLSDLFRRRKAAAEEEAPTEEQLPVAEPPKKSRFARRPKAEKQPKKSRFARRPKAEKQPKQPKPPKAPKEPRPRRQVAVGRRGKKLVGLKIGASQLAAARVVNNGQPELVQIAREPIEPGIVVGGELREPDALAEALKHFFRVNKLPRQGVRLGIASNRIGVRIFDIVGIEDEKQLNNAVRFRAQEALPIPLDEAVLDYQVLSESVDEEGVRTRRVLLVVAYRDLVERYVAACRKAGLRLAGVDLEAFAVLRALRADTNQSNAAVVVASVGHDRTTLAVANGPVCEFTRVIEWGGHHLNVAIARALDSAPSEVEGLKRSLSLLVPAESWEALAPEQAARVRAALHQELQAFARELVSSLQFYQGQPGSLGIGEIVLTGGTAHLPGIDAELARAIGVSVRVGDPLARVKPGKRANDPDQIGSLAVAIGLGIEEPVT
jgi:type IV pilus assembly protein PilM